MQRAAIGRLVTLDGQVTNGGLLLCDQGVLRQSRVFCTRWKGNCKGNIDETRWMIRSSRGPALSHCCKMQRTLSATTAKTLEHPGNATGRAQRLPLQSGPRGAGQCADPPDYQILGSEIHVDIFDDWLEFFSPGGMMNGQRIQDMDLHHIPSCGVIR